MENENELVEVIITIPIDVLAKLRFEHRREFKKTNPSYKSFHEYITNILIKEAEK